MATKFEESFTRLGLEQYLPYLLQLGCYDWHSVCKLTESDFASIGVKLGHRRKLQREAARRNLWPDSQALPSAGDIYQAYSAPRTTPILSRLGQREATVRALAFNTISTPMLPERISDQPNTPSSSSARGTITKSTGQATLLRTSSGNGYGKEEHLGHLGRWTEVTSSQEFIDHLLAL